MKTAILLLALVLLSVIAYAAHSSEDVIVRVVGYDPASASYTFSCAIPETASPERHWGVTPVPAGYEPDYYTTSPTLAFNLTGSELYRIFCEVQDNGTSLQGDFHIDTRLAPDPARPDAYVTSSEGLQASLHCDPPNGSVNYNMYWTLSNRDGATALSQFDNQQDIIFNVTSPGRWDVACGVWDNDALLWSQWGVPIEFFESGSAYVPTVEGCVPNDPCPAPFPGGAASNDTNETGSNETQPAPEAANQTISISCTDQTLNKSCVKLSDIDIGSCRTVSWAEPNSTAEGILAQACWKENSTLEVSRQAYNSTHNLEACFLGVCVDQDWGYRTETVVIPVNNNTQPVVNSTNSTNSTGGNSTNSTGNDNNAGSDNAAAATQSSGGGGSGGGGGGGSIGTASQQQTQNTGTVPTTSFAAKKSATTSDKPADAAKTEAKASLPQLQETSFTPPKGSPGEGKIEIPPPVLLGLAVIAILVGTVLMGKGFQGFQQARRTRPARPAGAG